MRNVLWVVLISTALWAPVVRGADEPAATTADMGALFFPQFNSTTNPVGANRENYILLSPYPNPFNSSTKIIFNISQSSNVRLAIYNILGREAANLVDGNLSAGEYTYVFDASQFASGVYIVVLETNGFRAYV